MLTVNILVKHILEVACH